MSHEDLVLEKLGIPEMSADQNNNCQQKPALLKGQRKREALKIKILNTPNHIMNFGSNIILAGKG
jgi:hypothetical protein